MKTHKNLRSFMEAYQTGDFGERDPTFSVQTDPSTWSPNWGWTEAFMQKHQGSD